MVIRADGPGRPGLPGAVSRPRGKSIQRELFQLAKQTLEPLGCHCEIDFSRRGGHQQLKVTMPRTGTRISLELPSSPQNEGNALNTMRQRINRVIRDYRLAEAA